MSEVPLYGIPSSNVTNPVQILDAERSVQNPS